jgi:shikimate dehydrogenase
MRQPSGKTHLLAVIADPVAHVRAPSFMNPLLEAKGFDAFAVPLHVRAADLADVVPRLAKLGNLRGFIVTIPHKETMAKLCTELGSNARLAGAVNTVRIEPDGRLSGDMFDGLGLMAMARANGMDPKGSSVLLVGAGGAGRAIAFALARSGVERIGVTNRTRARAVRLVEDVKRALPGVPVATAARDASGFDLVINCTSLGLKETDALPLDPGTIAASTDVIDIIAVRDTEWMQAARARGCRVVGGRQMIELQFEEQIRFIGEPPQVEP